MKAVRLHDPCDIRFETIAMPPPPGPGEVRVRVAHAGICGSDIHNYRTGQWITRHPSVAGHEFSGRVEAVGAAVEGFSTGDTVVADSRYSCARCRPCREGRAHLCDTLGFVGEAIDGGFAEYALLPARLLIRCEATAPLDVLALAEPLAVALHALRRVRIGAGDALMIVGCGPIGALAAIAARLDSDRDIYVCDIDGAREAHVARMTGATVASLDAMADDLRFVLDTTGNTGVIGALIDGAAGCTIGLVGIGSGTIPLDPVHLVEREIDLVGCHAFQDELAEAVALLQRTPQTFAPVIGHRITLEQTPDAYARIAAGKATGIKTMIDMGAEGADPS